MNAIFQEIPALPVAYIRHVGEYSGLGAVFGRMAEWVQKNNIPCGPETLWLAVYLDCPKTTPPEKCRTDVCMTVPEQIQGQAEVQRQTLPAGWFATFLCAIPLGQESEAFPRCWQQAGEWLQQNRREPEMRPPYEIYYNCAMSQPTKKWAVDICIPVKRT